MRTRPLPPKEILRILFSYNPETGDIVRRVPMSRYPAGSVAGSPQHDYIYVEYRRCRILAHRLAWMLSFGDWPPCEVDHINFNQKDNRIVNLRLASTTDNQRNRTVQSNSSTGIKGVAFNRQIRKYTAKITANKKQYHLGSFETSDEAAHAYNKAAIRLHGEFARLNPVGVDYVR